MNSPRAALQAALAEYAGRHPLESALAARFGEFVAAHADCFERTCVPGHVTGSAWLLSPDGDRALLTHHRKLGRWLQLGGHSDGDPDTLAVALREAREESGLPVAVLDAAIFDLDVHGIPARGAEPAHLHYDVRFLLGARTEAFQVSSESHDLCWVAMDAVAGLTAEESVLRMVRKWRSWRERGAS